MIGDAVAALNVALREAGQKTLHPASSHDLELAIQNDMPETLINFYRVGSPDSAIGAVELNQRIWSVQNAVSENKDYIPGAVLFPLGYVVFASNKCGDAYCLDTVCVHAPGAEPVVLFPHDALEEGASLKDVEPYRLKVAENLEDFMYQFAQRTLPEAPRYS